MCSLCLQGLAGSTLWGRFSALNSRFKLLGAGKIQDVYPTISIQLNNFTKQDPEPEHDVAFLMY